MLSCVTPLLLEARRWWKNRGNLVIRLPGSFFGLPSASQFFQRIKRETGRKNGKFLGLPKASQVFRVLNGKREEKTGSFYACRRQANVYSVLRETGGKNGKLG